MLDMIYVLLYRTNVVAVENDFAFQLIPISLDMIMFHHNHNHIYLIEELVKVQNLVGHNLLRGEERVKALQRTGQVAFLNVKHLKGRAFADVVDIFLVGDAVQTNSAAVREVVLLHDFIDALQDENRLAVIGLH